MLEKGQIIGGRYQIEGILGEGGMATVYRAVHTGTRRACALKVLRRAMLAHSTVGEMFVREAQVGALVGDNPSIVDVFDAAIDEGLGVPFLVMPLLRGQPLDAALAAEGPLPRSTVAAVFRQLGGALDQAHRQGVVHRDLKPSNLFLTSDAEGQPRIKILDFGIAKFVEAAASTQTATQIGTPAYAAPEQLAPLLKQLAAQMGVVVGKGIVPQTDIWPLGLMAYECLTGAAPGQIWGVSSPQELPLRSLAAAPVPSVEAGPAASLLPPGFDAWFARCLEKDPSLRWPSARDAADALLALLDAPGVAPPAPSSPLARPSVGASTSLGVMTFSGAVAAHLLPVAAARPASSAPMTSFAGGLGTHAPFAQTTPSFAQTSVPAPARRLLSLAAFALLGLSGLGFAWRSRPAPAAVDPSAALAQVRAEPPAASQPPAAASEAPAPAASSAEAATPASAAPAASSASVATSSAATARTGATAHPRITKPYAETPAELGYKPSAGGSKKAAGK